MDSIWQKELPPSPEIARPAGTTPVAIVGGGIAGVAVAYWLARDHGILATLCEQGRVAGGASGRNAGFLVTGPADTYDAAIGRWGARVARDVWRFSEANRALFLATWEQEEIDAGWEPTGHLHLADDPAEAAVLEATHRQLTVDGFGSVLWDAGTCRHASGSERFALGRWTPGDGQFHPVRAVTGLAAAAARRGVRIHPGCAVLQIEPRGGEWRVVTSLGPVAADAVVLAAAGPGVTALWPAAGERLTAVRAQALATSPLPVEIRMPLATRYGGTYWRRRADGGVVLGGERAATAGHDVGVSSIEPSAPVQQALDRFLAETYPDAPFRVTARWAGTLTYTQNGLPWVGSVSGAAGLYVATGWTGHGFGFAWEAGRRLAARMAGTDNGPCVPWDAHVELPRTATGQRPAADAESAATSSG